MANKHQHKPAPVWYEGTVDWGTLTPAQRLWLAVMSYEGIGCYTARLREAGFLIPDTHLYDEVADMVQCAGERDLTGERLATTVQLLIEQGSLTALRSSKRCP